MQESNQEIRKKIIEILDDDKNVETKALDIFHLTQKTSSQVGFEFLHVYSERFNESNPDRMSARYISRILSASFPFSVPEFLKFIGEDPERLVAFTEATKKYMKSFPFSYMDVMKIYHLPGLAASYFYGDDESRKLFQNMNTDVSAHHYGTLISAAILTNRNEALYEIISTMPPNMVSRDVVVEIINAKNYDWNVMSFIIDKSKVNFDEKFVTSSRGKSITLPVFIVEKAVSTGEQNCFNLFTKICEDYSKQFSIGTYKDILNYVEENSKNWNSNIKILNTLLDLPSLPPQIYTSIVEKVFNTPEIREHSDEVFLNKILDNKNLDNSFVNKFELITNILKNVIQNTNDNNNSQSHYQNICTLLEKLVDRFPNDFKNIHVYELWDSEKEGFPKKYPKLASWIKQDLIARLDVYQKDWSIENQGVFAFNSSKVKPYVTEFLSFNKFLVNKEIEKVSGGIFRKQTSIENILVWDTKAIENRFTENTKRESLSFLTTDSGEVMDLGLIKTLPNKQLQEICESLVMSAYQFSNFSNDPLISISEDSHFMKNNLPKMFNKIISGYHEYKVFDETSALESLTAQLVMLQRRTTKAMMIIIKDAKYDLENEAKSTSAVLEQNLTSRVKP